ncbi:cysteine proteinase [Linnemannia elongata AG-77]|uniref:Cysteine proteinase n=1 Tax=Linnemannia elongata AG-77 TaxID=1314771 RepID=A0A197JC55_9FUNG|nr:cysteine proteinase [Linnemannia elongata AG-77]
MAPVKTRSKHTSNDHHRYKADPEDTNDDDDIYGMRELKHQLASLNLQLKDTMGDGNCLFRACADQFSGTEKDHPALRSEVCQYIEDHEEHFKLFLDNETVEAHVSKMRRNGTYGGNIELVAFARMKKVDIKVYQPGYIYVIEGVDVKKEGSSPGQRPVMHIAYHSWEHYSSIRNIDGPFEGPPEINPRPVKQEPLRKLTNRDPPRSIERAIMKATGVDDLELVRELMEKYRGDVDSVYNDIYERQYPEDKEEVKEEEGGDVEEGQEKSSHQEKDAEPPKQENKAGSRKGTPRPSTPNVNTSDPAPPQSPESQKETGSSPEDSEPPSTPSDGVKGVIPKKRISSREKKEAAKRNQKQNRKNKGKTHPSGGDANSSENASSTLGGGDGKGGANTTSSTMRELFV